MKTLNERERHILIERRLKDNPTTLEELSQQYDISRERVRQIEVRAFEKLQKAMKAQIAERRLQSQSAAAARQPSGRPAADHSSPGRVSSPQVSTSLARSARSGRRAQCPSSSSAARTAIG